MPLSLSSVAPEQGKRRDLVERARERAMEKPDIETIRSRIKELIDIGDSSNDFSGASTAEEEKVIQDCIRDLDRRFIEIDADISDLGSSGVEDFDVCLKRFMDEVNLAEVKNANIFEEIKILHKTVLEDSGRVKSDLQRFYSELENIDSQGLDKWQVGANIGDPFGGGNLKDPKDPKNPIESYNFEILKLDHHIEKNCTTLTTLQVLDYAFQRVEALKQIEDKLSDVKVMELDGNFIRLSIQTFVPKSESILCQLRLDDLAEQSVVDHELLIELKDQTLELKNVKIFPEDVYIAGLVKAAKSVRHTFPAALHLQRKSYLEWLIRKIQYRIYLCTLRCLIVKDANKSRHSFTYFDRDETITAHLVDGVDVLLKISQSWPASMCPLTLASLMNSEFRSTGIPVHLLYKIQELANSLDVKVRQQLVSFVDAIEEIFIQEKRSEQKITRVQ